MNTRKRVNRSYLKERLVICNEEDTDGRASREYWIG